MKTLSRAVKTLSRAMKTLSRACALALLDPGPWASPARHTFKGFA